jgi:hypothetical protein
MLIATLTGPAVTVQRFCDAIQCAYGTASTIAIVRVKRRVVRIETHHSSSYAAALHMAHRLGLDTV